MTIVSNCLAIGIGDQRKIDLNGGPVIALCLPGCILKEENETVIFETDGIKGEPTVEISDVCGIPNHSKEIKI